MVRVLEDEHGEESRMLEDSTASLIQRVEKLERGNFRLKIALLALFVGVAVSANKAQEQFRIIVPRVSRYECAILRPARKNPRRASGNAGLHGEAHMARAAI